MKLHTATEKPLVTVVTVVFNDEAHIEKTIQSVLRQSYSNIEYIIIDGASTDATCSIIEKYREKIDFFLSEKDKGVYDGMNKGIQLAKGEWIHFLNSGDVFYDENVISGVFNNYTDNGESTIYGDTIYYNPNENVKTRVVARRVTNEPGSFMPSCHQSIFTRAVELKNYPFDLRYRVYADSNFYYELSKRNNKGLYTNSVISIYDSTGLSSRNKNSRLWERFLMYFRHRDIKCVVFFLMYIKNLIVNKNV